MIRAFRRLLYTSSLTRISAELAAARERLAETENAHRVQWTAHSNEGVIAADRSVRALEEEQVYVESKLEQVS